MPNDSENLESLVSLAKSAPTSKPRDFWWSEIRKTANRRRQPGQSIESAVAALIVDPDGAPLYKAMKVAPVRSGDDIAKSQELDADDGTTEGLRKLHAIAEKLRVERPELRLSKSSAIALAIRTPAGAAAYLEDRKSRTRVA
jgi:hypothetical protein